ncbi:MAG TPA: FAD-dependent oxidoreductase [Gaiellaceae bacterium]|nr:FAD-dependent oxidoreductase [Gaiellaceae bacterium]
MLADARVAIIGGGVAGCSLLYHLGLLGWTDAVLLEEDELTSGSTWHAAGLCTQFNPSYNMTGLLRYSVELYKTLAADYHECGSVRLATTQDRLDEFRHRAATAELLAVPVEVVGPERVRELHPLVEVGDVLAAAYLPTDGHVDPSSLTQALAAGAGERIFRRAPVTALERRDGAWTLSTPRGEVRAGIVVNAAGQWAPKVARLAGADLPIVALEHHYVVTDAIDELRGVRSELPVLRDPDGSFYVRQEGAGLLVGPFERGTRPWEVEEGFHARLLPPDVDRLEAALVDAGERIPAFATAGIKNVVNGPDGYTPDGRCLMGPVPSLRDFHVLAGFSIFGIVFAGGAGRYAAEWIVDGQPSDNMWELDVRRFGDYARRQSFLVPRAVDVYAREYAIHYPEEERNAGRPVKQDALHDALRGRGAVMGFRFGWERPLWFSRNGARDAYSMRRGNWHDAVGDECRAVRSAVGVLDQTSFAKYAVSGAGAEAFLDRLCANRLPALGRIALTQMCRPGGGIECDVTITRTEPERFYLVSAAATELHDYAWLEWHLPDDGSVELENHTERYGVLTLAGPRSRELLQQLVEEDVSREAFPFFRARQLEVGGVPTLTLRVSYVGELGFELHHPAEHLPRLYGALQEAGEPLGVVDFGYRALDSMRLEKAYRLWGADMSADWTPLEAGLERFVAFDKGDFVGREALLRQRAEGVRRTLACLTIETDDADPHGNEPVRLDGRAIGYVAAGGYGHVVEQSIALAYLPVEHAAAGTRLTVDILGEPRPAIVVPQPIYDPENLRLLS